MASRMLLGALQSGLAAVVAMALAWPAEAQSPVEKGRQIATRLCAQCHALGATGDSPHKLAPPFRELPKRYPVANLAEALAEGIVVSHKDMPQFTLDPEEIDAMLAFLDSLGPQPKSK